MLGNVSFSMPSKERIVDPRWIKARVIVKKIFDGDEDQDWPQYFLTVPQKGDQLRTPGGRTLDVLSVVHTSSGGEPEIQLEIGVSSDAVTPAEGGGAGEGFV